MTKTQSAYEVTGGGSAQCDASVVSRRGVALMLVVIAMGAATVMTTAYLLSKDNSAAIGANAQDTAASAWVARSGAGLALAVLQTQEDWVDAEPEKLLEGFTIGGGTVSVALTDMQGLVPDGTETELAMTVVADVNGIKTVLQRIVSIRPESTVEASVDGELSEFGVYMHSNFYSEPNSIIAAWPLSPAFKSGGPVKLGVGFTSAGGLTVDPDLVLPSVALFVPPDATATLKSMVTDSVFRGGDVLGFHIPSIPAILPDSLVGLVSHGNSPLKILDNSGPSSLEPGEYSTVTISNNGTVAVLDEADGGAYLLTGNLDINSGATLKIKGQITLGVIGSMSVSSGATIVLADDESSLRVYSGKGLTVDDAGIGIPAEIAQDSSRVVTDLVDYVSPARIKVFSLSAASGGSLSAWYNIKNQSIVNMVIHAPHLYIQIMSGSSMIGRVTCDMFAIWRDGALYYDHALDPKTGYTAMNGPFYKADGTPQDGLAAALASYDTSLGLDPFAAYVLANVNAEVIPADSVVLGDPTPRSHGKAIKKHWPFVAKSIESGSWVSGDNEERQDDLYVELDPTIFDLDQFYNDGVISATHVGAQDLDPDAGPQAPVGIGGL